MGRRPRRPVGREDSLVVGVPGSRRSGGAPPARESEERDVRESEMDILLDAMRALVDERHGVQHEVLDSGEEITYVMYRSPHGPHEVLGTVTYDWGDGDGLWEAETTQEGYLGYYDTHDEAVAAVVWYAPAAHSRWDRHLLVGPWLITSWMSAPDVQDAVRRAFPGRDLPVR